MRRMAIIFFLVLAITMLLAATALAAFPSGTSSSQYSAVNNALVGAAAQAGISTQDFINIYNTAASGGSLAGYNSTQLAASCGVLSSLSSYESVLTDYNTVYNNLGCGTRLASTSSSRGALPSTGIAIALLAGSGIIGVGGAAQLLRKGRRNQA